MRHGLNFFRCVAAALGTPPWMDQGVRREETKIGRNQSAIGVPAPCGSEDDLNRIAGNVDIEIGFDWVPDHCFDRKGFSFRGS